MLIDPPSSALRRRLRKAHCLAELRARNVFSRTAISDSSSNIDVSLTSFGHRLQVVGYTIESIAQGRVRPRRIILWVSDEDFAVEDYPMLRRLISRGLEIRKSENYRSHQKYYPYALHLREPGKGMVTADDDILYPAGWLEGLSQGVADHPGEIIGYRAAAICFDASGAPRPYIQWHRLGQPEFGDHVLLTGVAGIYYPFEFLERLAEAGDAFLETCPTADDLWIHNVAVKAGFRIRKISSEGMYLLSIPGTQKKNPLHKTNVTHGQNDVQFAAITSAEELERIRKSAEAAQEPIR